VETPAITELASGLKFPEGPVVLPDGSVAFTEIARGEVNKVAPDGTKSTIATTGGGPNGLALGPDGALYVCNNGGCFNFIEIGDLLIPGPLPEDWTGGSIQRIDLGSGEVTTLYTECDGFPLRAPNDLVFDADGGFWFTDHGVRDHTARTSDLTGIYYAKPDGSSITMPIFPMEAPNGVGLSPDGATLYVAETHTARLYRWDLEGPGQPVIVAGPSAHGGTQLAAPGGMKLFDSLAVDGEGHVVIGTLGTGGLTIVEPSGLHDFVELPDPLVTNVCFGGDDLRTAYVTCSAFGRLISFPWPRPGLALAF
jgi:gluconolactonase